LEKKKKNYYLHVSAKICVLINLSAADIVLVYQRNIYHGVGQGGAILKADLNRSLSRKSYGLFYTWRTWVMKYLAPLDTNNPPKEDGAWLSI